jgi:hypothetical protein
MEKAIISDFVAQGIPLWNKGDGHREKTYLGWKIPIIQRMLSSAAARYSARAALKRYVAGRP